MQLKCSVARMLVGINCLVVTRWTFTEFESKVVLLLNTRQKVLICAEIIIGDCYEIATVYLSI